MVEVSLKLHNVHIKYLVAQMQRRAASNQHCKQISVVSHFINIYIKQLLLKTSWSKNRKLKKLLLANTVICTIIIV